MSPRTEKQFEEIRQEKKQLIFDAALNLFANHGYHATSMSQLAKKANISKGLIYNYFESKEDLLRELMIAASNEIHESFDPNKDGVLTKDEFIFFIKQNIKVIKKNIEFWRLYSSIMMQPGVSELITGLLSDMSNNMTVMLIDFFKRMGAKDPQGELLMFITILKGASVMYITNPEAFPIDELEKKILNHYQKDCYWLND